MFTWQEIAANQLSRDQIMKIQKAVIAILMASALTSITGCEKKLNGAGPEYYTTAFQCDMKHSNTGWCFATPTRVYSSEYKLAGKGAVQDFIIPNGKVCVSNTEGCIPVHVEIKDRE